MKKYLLFSLVLTATISMALAQKINESEVPEAVKTSFSIKFPGVNAKWEKEKSNYEAGFKKDGKTMSATFQPDGIFLESETDIPNTALPGSILNYVKNNYKDKKIKESAKISSADGTITYEAEVEGKDLIFDINGVFLKEVKD